MGAEANIIDIYIDIYIVVDVFNMRQGLAHDLKVKIDRAERMSEKDLADLRLDIKVIREENTKKAAKCLKIYLYFLKP